MNSRYYDPEIGRFINADGYVKTPNDSLLSTNMFAYCDNNPIMRADSCGEFWHMVVGTVVGGLLGGVVKTVSNLVEGKNITDGLGTAVFAGAASGLLASTGVGVIGMAVGNAAISMAENATNQIIANKGFSGFDVADMAVDGVIGGIAGAIGGKQTGTKHLNYLGKQTVKRTVKTTMKKGIKSGLTEARKAFSYYGKNTQKYYKDFRRGLIVDALSTIGTTIATSNYMKCQYQRLMER